MPGTHRSLIEAFELPGLPVLGAGSHPDPSAGACVMEYASLLSGLPWSDHPRCTHPALAQLARLINDMSPAPVRQRLLPLVPDLIGPGGKDVAVAPALVLLCLDRLRAVQPKRSGHDREERSAQRRLQAAGATGFRGFWMRFTEPMYRGGAAFQLMVRTVRAVTAAAPDALPDLLAAAITTARQTSGADAPRPSARPAGVP